MSKEELWIKLRFGDVTAQALGRPPPGPEALDEPVHIEGPVHVEIELKSGRKLGMRAYHIIVYQDKGRINHVLVFPSDELADFSSAAGAARRAAESFRIHEEPNIRESLQEWAGINPKIDYFSRYIARACLQEGVTVELIIRPTASMDSWSLSADVLPSDSCVTRASP